MCVHRSLTVMMFINVSKCTSIKTNVCALILFEIDVNINVNEVDSFFMTSNNFV